MKNKNRERKEKIISSSTRSYYTLSKKTGLVFEFETSSIVTKKISIRNKSKTSEEIVDVKSGYREWNEEGMDLDKVRTFINSTLYKVTIDIKNNIVKINNTTLPLNKKEYIFFRKICEASQKGKGVTIDTLNGLIFDNGFTELFDASYKRLQRIAKKLKKLLLRENFQSFLLYNFYRDRYSQEVGVTITEKTFETRVNKIIKLTPKIKNEDAHSIAKLLDKKESTEELNRLESRHQEIIRDLKSLVQKTKFDLPYALGVGLLSFGEINSDTLQKVSKKIQRTINDFNIKRVLFNKRGVGYKLLLNPDSINIVSE